MLIIIRPGGLQVEVVVSAAGEFAAARYGGELAVALLQTVSDGADVVLNVAPGVVGTDLVAATASATIADLHGERLVVWLGGGLAQAAVLSALGPMLARFCDCRLFIALDREPPGAIDPVVAALAAAGYRTFVLDASAPAWREARVGGPRPVLSDAHRPGVLYATPAERCRTVSTVIHRGGLTGAERSHTDLVESLVRQGGMAHTVVPLPDEGLREALTAIGSSVDLIDALPWWMHPMAADGDGPAPMLDESVFRHLRAVDADVLMTETSVVAQGALAAAALGKPHVWFIREFGDIDQGLSHPWGRAEFARVVRSLSDVIVVNSSQVRDYVFGPAADGIRVLCPAPRIDTMSPTSSNKARAWTVSIVASLISGKGQRDAIEALSLMREDATPVHLALVGPDGGAEKAVLQSLARQRGVADLVEFRGRTDDRAQAYGDTDAVAVTSHAEAFGRVPFEATAFGLPVIYANAGGPADYMKDGRTGLAYEVGDAAGLAAAIRLLRDHPDRGIDLVTQARADLGGPERRAAFDAAVMDLFLPLTGRVPRAVPEVVLAAVGQDAFAQVAVLDQRFAEQLESAIKAHAMLAEEREALQQVLAENAALRAAAAELRNRLGSVLRSRVWRLRMRIVAMIRRTAR